MPHEIPPIHPGEVLLEVYMKPACPELTVEALSDTLQLQPKVIADVIAGQCAITPSLAVRLGVICRTTAKYWLDMQRSYDLRTEKNRRHRRRTKGPQSGHSAAAA
jgi:addiction module HigA family antidote